MPIPCQSYFNPRSRAGSDCYRCLIRRCIFEFQSTLPRGERRSLEDLIPWITYFNPRSRAGSDRPYDETWGWNTLISIHAPARGATVSRIDLGGQISIFQSTLPRGERPSFFNRLYILVLFQSTLPRGERLACTVTPEVRLSDFNPRSRAGSDLGKALILRPNLFQSTLPRGERRISHTARRTDFHISIHAPARGAT